jgi:CubicO group peptidase (beta-lactamase class C family)
MGFGTNNFVFGLGLACVVSCGAWQPQPREFPDMPDPPPADFEFSPSFGQSTPDAQGVDPRAMIRVANWVRNNPAPIFSLLISRHGKLIFELYTAKVDRCDAHYVMSVTKSFTSALVGIAIDQKLLRDENESLAEALPKNIFATAGDVERFRPVTIKDVLGMSALDAPVFPHQKDELARARNKGFVAARNRLIFALSQNILSEPGKDFLYTDVTPVLATGMIELAAHETAFDFAKKNLFDPLGFQNEEWMHEDAAGIDNGAYGLRLRPIDMQKFGVLYLRNGKWNGTQIISEAWVQKSFTPWIRSDDDYKMLNYGWYWWQQSFGGEIAHVANGWKGQRIAVVPSRELVVTMTAAIEDGSEEKVFAELMNDYVMPALTRDVPLNENREGNADLKRALYDVANGTMNIHETLEKRMIPTIAAHDKRHPLAL